MHALTRFIEFMAAIILIFELLKPASIACIDLCLGLWRQTAFSCHWVNYKCSRSSYWILFHGYLLIFATRYTFLNIFVDFGLVGSGNCASSNIVGLCHSFRGCGIVIFGLIHSMNRYIMYNTLSWTIYVYLKFMLWCNLILSQLCFSLVALDPGRAKCVLEKL